MSSAAVLLLSSQQLRVEVSSLPLQHLLGHACHQPHELLHVKRVVGELGVVRAHRGVDALRGKEKEKKTDRTYRSGSQ